MTENAIYATDKRLTAYVLYTADNAVGKTMLVDATVKHFGGLMSRPVDLAFVQYALCKFPTTTAAEQFVAGVEKNFRSTGMELLGAGAPATFAAVVGAAGQFKRDLSEFLGAAESNRSQFCFANPDESWLRRGLKRATLG